MPPMPSGYIAPALLERRTPNYNYVQLPSGVIVASDYDPVIEADVPSGPTFSPPGAYSLSSLGAPVALNDSTSSLTPIPIPARNAGDLLIAFGAVATIPNPSQPLFEQFPGDKWNTILILGQSFSVDPNFGDFVMEIRARIATGDVDDETIKVRGQGRPRFGQVACFTGNPASLTNILTNNGDEEPITPTTTLDSIEVNGTGFNDTLALLGSMRRGNPTGADNPITVDSPPPGMTTLATFNIPSVFSTYSLIGGWCYASRSVGENRAGAPWGASAGFTTSERTLSAYANLKSSVS